MIVFTTKVTRKKVLGGVLALSLIVCSCFAISRDIENKESFASSDEQVMEKEEMSLKSNDDRVSLIEGYGWTVDKEPLEFMEVRIPEKFDGVYSEYNEIQKKQGLDLEKYSGKRVMRYTYRVTNHPSKEENVIANIIIYKDKLIAGDICSSKLGGFMHGLLENSTTAENEDKNEQSRD
ncbi:MAG: DUF4830 domain-containing protein [Oscillospiraceae bacterium]|nr:DUF4830 domain-containing protein [Oscillospiraceae bacterium]